MYNKPPRGAGISEDNTQGWQIVQNEQLAKKWSFKGNCETFEDNLSADGITLHNIS